MCGTEGKLYRVKIEGTEMNVCSGCSKFGDVLGEVKRIVEERKIRNVVEEPEAEVVEMVVEDFAQRIRRKRNELGLNQEDFAQKINQKKSFVHQIENNEMNPRIELAKKLGRMLGIELVEEVVEERKEIEKVSSGEEVTIGDFIKIKHRKKSI